MRRRSTAPAEFPHGTRARYLVGCRCAVCREATVKRLAQAATADVERGARELAAADRLRLAAELVERAVAEESIGELAIAFTVGNQALSEIYPAVRSRIEEAQR